MKIKKKVYRITSVPTGYNPCLLDTYATEMPRTEYTYPGDVRVFLHYPCSVHTFSKSRLEEVSHEEEKTL